MSLSKQLSVITPVSRPQFLPLLAPTIPADAEWILITDGPLELPPGLRPHTMIEGPRTGKWGDAQRQIGVEAASRPFMYFLDDDNLMLPNLADRIIPHLNAEHGQGLLFGLLLNESDRALIWSAPISVERHQVDTAMFIGRTEAVRSVRYQGNYDGAGWPDIHSGRWPLLAGERCADFVFLQSFEQTFGLLRQPAIHGFHNGVELLRTLEPESFSALEAGELAPQMLAGIVRRNEIGAGTPPWYKPSRPHGDDVAGEATRPAPGSLAAELMEMAGFPKEGSSVPAQWGQFQRLARTIATLQPNQPVNVFEIGFNAGLSSAAFLEASPQVHVVSVEMAQEPFMTACAQHLQSRFPNRFHLLVGDSRKTVPRFATEAGERFDLILIDGGHEIETCRADVLNTRGLAAHNALVIVDDLLPENGYGAGPSQVWEDLLSEQVLLEPQIWCSRPGATEAEADDGGPTHPFERRWGLARFAEA